MFRNLWRRLATALFALLTLATLAQATVAPQNHHFSTLQPSAHANGDAQFRPGAPPGQRRGFQFLGAGQLAVGSTWVWVGDGVADPLSSGGGVGLGAANAADQFQLLMAGRLQPGPAPKLGESGTTIKTNDGGGDYAWIYPYAIDAAASQAPNVFVLGTMGANDNVLSTQPCSASGCSFSCGSTISTWFQDWCDAVDYAHTKFAAYAGTNDLFVVVSTVPSAKSAETTVDTGQTDDRRTRVWAQMQAKVLALAQSDPRVIFVPLTGMLPVTSYSIDSPLYVHSDQRGAYYQATQVFNAVDAHVQAKTPDQIVDMIVAGTYPLMGGSQLDTDTALAGTGGTVTGPGITGTIATTKATANTTASTGITVSQVSTTSGRTKTVLDFTSATSGTGGRVIWQDKSNLSVTATPGKNVMTGFMVSASAGFWNYGADWNGGLFGTFAGTGASLAANGKAGAGSAQAMSTLVMINPYSLYSSNTTFTGKRTVGLYWPTGVTPTGTFEIQRPFYYLISDRLRAAPYYLGDLANANGVRLFPVTQAVRASGTVSNAAGGTPRVEPGLWNLFGLTESDYAARRLYDCATASTAIASCTLLGTLTGSTWTLTITAGQVTTGHVIRTQVDVNNGIGGTVTATNNSALASSYITVT